MADHNEHISKDLASSQGEPRPSDAVPDGINQTDGHDDAPGLGSYIGRAGAGARTLARAVISRSVEAGNRVRRPIGTTLAKLGGMLPGVTGRGGGIGLFRGSIQADDAPARFNGLEPSRLVWLRPVLRGTDSVEPVSGPVKSDAKSRHPGKSGGLSAAVKTKTSSTVDSSVSRNERRQKAARNARPIGRAAATRIRPRPDTRSLRGLPTYVESPARMKTERRIEGMMSRPVVSKSKWAPTEYESTKERPPASLEKFLERNVAAPKEHRLRPVSVSRHGNSKSEIPAGRSAAENGAKNFPSEDDGTAYALKSTGLDRVSVIHRGVAEPVEPSDKKSGISKGRPRIFQRSKQIISRSRDALLRRRSASNSTREARTERSAANRPDSTFGTAEPGSSGGQSERISPSPLPKPRAGRKMEGTPRVQSDPISATATVSDARNVGVPAREQPSADVSSSADAEIANPRPAEVNISSSIALDVEVEDDKAKSIVNRARELVFRKPSDDIRPALNSDEATSRAEAIQRRPDSKATSDIKRPGKTGTVLARALGKLARKPKAAGPTASTSDQQASQETLRPAEMGKKPAIAADESVAAFAKPAPDAGAKTPQPLSHTRIDNVAAGDTSANEPGISRGKEKGTETSLLSQPVMEHRADKHEPDHTEAPAETIFMSERAEKPEPVRRASKKQDAESNDTGGRNASPTMREPDHTAVPAVTPFMAERAEKREPVRRASKKQDAESNDTGGASASPTTREPEQINRPAPLIARAARGIKLGVQRLVLRSVPSASPAVPEPPLAQPKASRTRVRAPSRDAGHRTVGPMTATEGKSSRPAPELLHRQISQGPVESIRRGDTSGKATLRSPLVRSSDGPVINSGVRPSVPRGKGDAKPVRPASRPRTSLNRSQRVQRSIQPAATDTRSQHPTANMPTLNSEAGRSSDGPGPEATLAEFEAGQNGATAEGLGGRLGPLVHKRESHGVAGDEAPRAGSAQPSGVSQAARAGVPTVQRSSSAKERASSHKGAVRRSSIARAPASGNGGTPSREPATPAQTAEVDLVERDEPLYKKFTPADIEFLSTKMFTYIKRKLNDDRERHGHPGFSMWS